MARNKAATHAQELNKFRDIVPETVTQGIVSVRIEYPDGVTETLTSPDAWMRVNARRPGTQDKGERGKEHWEINLHLTLEMEEIPSEEQ